MLYLATVPWTDDFRMFLQGTAAFLTVVPSWTLRLVFPQPLDRVYTAYQTVVREELETPLHRATIGELQWYFEHRQEALGQGVHPLTQGFLDRAAKVFNTPRFTLLYRRWLRQGDAAFQAVSSPVFADALASGTGRVECLVLSRTYRHLSPLGNLVRSLSELKQGERRWLPNAKRSGLAQSQPLWDLTGAVASRPSGDGPLLTRKLTSGR